MDSIPLLPRDVVAYPGETVTIRLNSEIEEAIVKDAMESGSRIGLILAEPTDDGQAVALTPDATGSGARVLVYEPRNARGRGQAVLRAERRFRATRVSESIPYPRVEVLWLPEPVGDVRQAKTLESAVRAYLDPDSGPRHADGIGEASAEGSSPLALAEGPVEASFAAAAALTATVDVKQRLLAAGSATERLGLAHAVLHLQERESVGAPHA